jgi:hypothetical protein
LADLFIDAHQLVAEFLEAVELGDLLLGLPRGGRIRKRFGHSFARESPSEAELRIVGGS